MAEISRKVTYYWPVFLGFIIFAVSVSGAHDPYFITGFLLALLIGISGHGKSIRLTQLDCAVLAVWVYELILLFTSPTGHIAPFQTLTLGTTYYGALRLGFGKMGRMKPFLFWCSSFLFGMALIATVSFHLFENKVIAAGFEDLYDFRFLHNSLGYLGNVWGTLLIGFLGLIALTAYLYRDRRGLCILLSMMTLPVVWGIVRSFSRGVYAAFGLMTAVFLVSLLAARVSWKRKVLGIIAVSCFLALLTIPYKAEVLRTLRMTETASQRRSMAGRLHGAAVTLEIIRQHPWVGTGSGNFSLAANEHLYENDYTPFTSIGLGTGFQLPVEKGIIGVLLWLAIPGVLIGMLVKSRRQDVGTIIIFTTLGAVMLREITFPVLLDYAGLQLVVFTLIAVYRNSLLQVRPVYIIPETVVRWIIWSPTLVCTGILVANLCKEAREEANLAGLKALIAGDMQSAESHLVRAGDRLPYRINRSALYWRMFRQTGDRNYLTQAEHNLRAAGVQNPMDIQLTYNLAVVLDAAGASDSSLRLMRGLVGRFPDNALYRVTLFEMARECEAPEAEEAENLVRAIELAPDLLQTPLWRDLQVQDSALSAEITTALRVRAQALCKAIDAEKQGTNLDNPKKQRNFSIKNGYDPLLLAHYGKIMFIFGQRESSAALLGEAAAQLPNLSRPWCHLGILALEEGDTARGLKYMRRVAMLDPEDTLTQRYLTEYVASVRQSGTDNMDTAVYPYRFLYRKARIKFRAWYDAIPLTFDYIGTPKSRLAIETK